MRFSRFRQQMEGIQPPPRKPRSAIASNKKSKKEKLKSKPKSKEENRLKREDSKPIKTESRDVLENPYSEAPIDALVSIKNEPNSEGLQNNIEAMEGIASNSHGPPKLKFEPEQESQIQTLPSECPKVKEEPSVKIEPAWD